MTTATATRLTCYFCGDDTHVSNIVIGDGVRPVCTDILACVRRTKADDIDEHIYGSEGIVQGPRDWTTGP